MFSMGEATLTVQFSYSQWNIHTYVGSIILKVRAKGGKTELYV